MSEEERPAEASAPTIPAESEPGEAHHEQGEQRTIPGAADASRGQQRRRALLFMLGVAVFLLIVASAPLLLPTINARLNGSTAAHAGVSSTATDTGSPGAFHTPATQKTATPGAIATGGTAPTVGTTPTGSTTQTGAPTATSTTASNPTATPNPPQISVTPSSLDFSLTLVSCLANRPTQTLTIQNTGSGTLNWGASLQNATYLSINPTSGSLGPAQKMLIAVTLVCSVTLHTTDDLFLTSNGGTITIPVTINLI